MDRTCQCGVPAGHIHHVECPYPLHGGSPADQRSWDAAHKSKRQWLGRENLRPIGRGRKA